LANGKLKPWPAISSPSSGHQLAPPLCGVFFCPSVTPMTDMQSNVGELALELFEIAEEMVLLGEDPLDVRAAFYAVAIRMKQLSDEAEADALGLVKRMMN
jgi:hypothetical protein